MARALESGTLTSTKGSFVKQLERSFAELLGVEHCYACSSGTSAVHTAVAAVDPEPGDEIITSPITDMGALTPILYQGAIPVFADVDPVTLNLTPATIERVLSDRTRAIIVTHLFGSPCPIDEIMRLARNRGIPVIEDCAQSFLARHQDQLTGTIGDIGCFSLQQGKHITCGEGGLVTCSDPDLARRMFLFINKAWGYGDENPDHYFLALNSRMSELQGAVALAQLAKLESSVNRRNNAASRLTQRLRGLPGVACPQTEAGDVHAYWRYALRVDSKLIPGGADALGSRLRQLGFACAPRYIQKPAFECAVIRERRTFGSSGYPFTLARPEAVDYDRRHFPGTMAGLEQVLVLPWNEQLTAEHVDSIADAIQNSVASLIREAA